MARPKKIQKETSYVTLRTKPVSKGRLSYYLDIYANGVRKYEFLKLYIVPETTRAAKTQNINTELAAKAIRNKRELEIIQNKGNLPGMTSSKMLLLDWLDIYRKRKEDLGISASRDTTLQCMAKHLKAYAKDKVKLSDVDEEFCLGFIKYLSNCNNLSYKEKKIKISKNTASLYYQIFESALNEAVRKKLIPVNPSVYIDKEDRKLIKSEKTNRAFLTIHEVKMLIQQETKFQEVKNAFLFACFTGLRISDIRKLTWDSIYERDGTMYLNIRMTKTKEVLNMKLNKQAVKWLPPKKESKKVFHLNMAKPTITYNLKTWAKDAGIKKEITFHISRHTFATMELTLGADIYVVSKLLGHTDVKVTQIYADIINKKREEAVDLLDTAFE